MVEMLNQSIHLLLHNLNRKILKLSNTDIINQVIELAADSFMIDSSSMKPHTTFLELEIDSLDFVDFIINVESHFDILIPEEEMKALWSLSLVADYVFKNLA